MLLAGIQLQIFPFRVSLHLLSHGQHRYRHQPFWLQSSLSEAPKRCHQEQTKMEMTQILIL